MPVGYSHAPSRVYFRLACIVHAIHPSSIHPFIHKVVREEEEEQQQQQIEQCWWFVESTESSPADTHTTHATAGSRLDREDRTQKYGYAFIVLSKKPHKNAGGFCCFPQENR